LSLSLSFSLCNQNVVCSSPSCALHALPIVSSLIWLTKYRLTNHYNTKASKNGVLGEATIEVHNRMVVWTIQTFVWDCKLVQPVRLWEWWRGCNIDQLFEYRHRVVDRTHKQQRLQNTRGWDVPHDIKMPMSRPTTFCNTNSITHS
jgi:hypothetical protein